MVKFLKQTATPGKVELIDGPIPEPEESQLLVKVAYVAQNPVDNELSTLSPFPGCTIGHEYSGIVEKVHPSVTRFKAGDRVAGGTFGSCSTHLHWGAFGEYCIGFEQTALKIPDSVGLEQAVTLPAGVGVAGLVIEALGGEGAFKGKPFFVNGGASGMGMVAIQLLKNLGATPIIATASPKNFELVKGFGADHVFDYHNSEYTSEIVKISGEITKALDCTAAKNLAPLYEAVIAPSGGKVIILNPPEFSQPPSRPEIQYEMVNVFDAYDAEYEIFGQKSPGSKETKRIVGAWAEKVQGMLEKGEIKALRVKKMVGGLESVGGNMGLFEEGKVSGEKVVYQVAEV